MKISACQKFNIVFFHVLTLDDQAYGDCYIFQYAYPAEDREEFLIGTWFGKCSFEEERVAAILLAVKMVESLKHQAAQVRLYEGNEPIQFYCIFESLIVFKAVVLFAMGGYGTYLGFRIRLSKDAEEKAMAKDLHPKLLAGMFFLFALGATGCITTLLTSDKPILESPHAITGLIGLSLLTIQTLLPTLFEENPGLRTVHGLLLIVVLC